MCVIIHSPDKKHRPTLETLKACERANYHGCGIAWAEGARVRYLKGLNAQALHDSLGMIPGPVIVHFRYATVGAKCEKLCHPFPVTEFACPKVYGSAEEVLFHNGHWSDWQDFAAHYSLLDGAPERELVSDSRVLAIGYAHLGLTWLQKTCPGRVALFSASEGVRLLGDWNKHQGCEFSNFNWVRRPDPSKPIFPVKTHGGRRSASDCGDAMACYGE